MDYLELSKALNAFGKYVIQQSRSNLTKGKPPYGDKNDTGALYNSLKYEPRQEEGAFLIDFIMEDYGAFVDEGWMGAGSSSNNRTSPFKFGSGTGKKGGLTKGIEKWIKRKPIKQWKDKKTGKKKCSACGREGGESRSKYPKCRPTPSACSKKANYGKQSKEGKKG